MENEAKSIKCCAKRSSFSIEGRKHALILCVISDQDLNMAT